jgi:hypothetical protein
MFRIVVGFEMDDALEALIESEVERGLRQTQAALAAFPRARRMQYLRLMVEEHHRLEGRSVAERVQHLRVLMQAIDAAAGTSGARPGSGRRSRASAG